MKTTLKITFDIVGFHHYPGAPPQVSFLENVHRHVFKVCMDFSVTDLNRELEFFKWIELN